MAPELRTPDLMMPGATLPMPTTADAVAPAVQDGGAGDTLRRPEPVYRLVGPRWRRLLGLLLGAEAISVVAVIGYGISWVIGAAGSAEAEFQPGVGQQVVLSLTVPRLVGFIVPLAGLAALLGWSAIVGWRQRQIAAPTGPSAALVQSMLVAQPIVLPGLTIAGLLIAFKIGDEFALRPGWVRPFSITTVAVAVALGLAIALWATVRVRPVAATAARLLTGAIVVALAAGCLVDVRGQRDLGFSSEGFVRTGQSAGVAGLACPLAGRCVALGVAATELTSGPPEQTIFAATGDGGRSWNLGRAPTVPGDVILPTLTCPSIEQCYVVGALFLSGQAENSVLVLSSPNGGRSWRSVLIPAFAPIGPRLPAIACLTPARCIVANSEELALTTDAGRSWRVVRVAALGQWFATNTLASCSDSRHCLVVSAVSRSTLRPARTVDGFDLYATSDGGSTWTASRVLVGDERDEATLSGLTCGRAGGCIVSWSSSNANSAASISTVSVSGRGWTDVTAPNGQPELFGLACFGEICLGSGRTASTSGFFASTDGGRRWSFRSGGPPRVFACWSPRNCVTDSSVNGPAGTVAALSWSNDGGHSWHRVAFPVARERAGQAVQPVNP